eukprot:682842_1
MAQSHQEQKDDGTPPYIVDTVKLWGYPGTDDNYAYFIIDRETSQCMVVDPAVCEPPIMKRYKELKQQYEKLELVGVLTTHKHHDHSAGNGEMKKAFKNIKVYGGKADNIKQYLKENTFTDEVTEGDVIPLGKNTKITVFDVPCHTQGHVLYFITDNNDQNPSLITGDTLFVGGVGHFFEGNAQSMLNNFKKIGKFPKETKLYVGHEYALGNYAFGVFIEPQNKILQQRYQWATKLKTEGGICVPSTVQMEMDSNVFMRTSNKALQENLKKSWVEAGKDMLNAVGKRYAVNVNDDVNKWTEADVMGALRHLKTSGYHKVSQNDD